MSQELSRSPQAAAPGDPDEPQPGSRVSMIPTTQPAPALPARLENWLASPGGLAISADVVADPAAVAMLSGVSVWANFLTPAGMQVVVTALARQPHSRDDVLELTGVSMLAREPRRDAIRAALRQDVRLVSGDVEYSATTLDLSSGGVRVQVAEPGAFPVGQQVEVFLDLEATGPLAAAGQVVRSDPIGHELAVRFIDLAESDEAVLDAAVYESLGGH